MNEVQSTKAKVRIEPLQFSEMILFFFALMFLPACGFFGNKTDISFIDVPLYSGKQVAYVPVQPVLDGFTEPVDVIIGYDEMIYVADAGTEEIVSLDLSGKELGRMSIPGISRIAQDRALDILAIGSCDTLIGSNNVTLTTLVRIDLKQISYGLNSAVITNRIVHPFYFKSSFDPGKDILPKFTGIAVRADNSFYLSRTGPNVSQVFGSDDAVLLFGSNDILISPIVVTTQLGIFNDYFKIPMSITGRAQAPQSPFVNESGDFIVTSFSPTVALKVQYITENETETGIDYRLAEMITGDTTKADGFLYSPYRFATPADVTYTGDGTNYLFVVDSEKDSVYQFTNTGLEGVKPPAGSTTTKNIRVSFGGSGTGLTRFDRPMGVAYYNEVLYVADAGNGRVLRFKLTTDLE